LGVIIEELRRVLRRQVDEHGIVVWYDPERHYEPFLGELGLSGTTLLRYEGSFYALREQAAGDLQSDELPKLVIYVPLTPEETRQALAELEVLGVVVRPGKQPATQNTKLAVIARRVLKGKIPEARLANLEKEIDKGQLDVASLEALGAAPSPSALPTVLAVLFQASQPDEVALEFLGSRERDRVLEEKNAVADLAGALGAFLGVIVDPEKPLEEIRRMLARGVLVAELVDVLGEDLPPALETVTAPENPELRRRAVEIARAWRNRLDLAAAYVQAADRVEPSLHFDSIEVADHALARVEAFRAADRMLVGRVAARLAAGVEPDLVELAEQRCAGFWAGRDPALQAQWSLVLQAAELIQAAARVREALAAGLSCEVLAARYTSGEEPLCRLDTVHREMERKAARLELQLHMPEQIEKLLAEARRAYAEAAGELAERFTRALAAAGFQIPGLYRQNQVFDVFVAPRLAEGRTGYVWVDALRFEMARELRKLLESEFEIEIQPVVGMMPGVTPVGMAALLPHAGAGIALRASGKGLEVRVGDTVLRNRNDRIVYLKAHVEAPVVVLRLEDRRGLRRKLREVGEDASLVLVTSREIDQSGEEGLTAAGEMMDMVLDQLSGALRRLAEQGVEQFVVVADHGHLCFGEALAESMKIDPPGGTTVLLHRRVWVGVGGADSERYLRTELRKLGVESDLEVAVPWNLACFKAGGSGEYFHGGLSPQEVLVPVMALRSRRAGARRRAKKFDWKLALGSEKITSRFFSVQIHGERKQRQLLEKEWPNVRIEVRSEKNEVCAGAVSSSYGFNESTGIISLRGRADNADVVEPNAVALMLTGRAPVRGKIAIHLIDAASGVELERLKDVEVALVF